MFSANLHQRASATNKKLNVLSINKLPIADKIES